MPAVPEAAVTSRSRDVPLTTSTTGPSGGAGTWTPPRALRNRRFRGVGWRLPVAPVGKLKGVLSGGVLGVDLNAGHLATWVLDQGGVASPKRVDVRLAERPLPGESLAGDKPAAIAMPEAFHSLGQRQGNPRDNGRRTASK